jgi:hypothetical protein
MGTYLQWRARADKGEVKRVTWVCGPIRRLVEEVVDRTRDTVGADEVDSVSFVAGETLDRDIWASVNQFGSGDGTRMICVREAERIKNWGQFLAWYESRELPRTHVLFVSSEPDTDTSTEHMQTIMKRGRYVRCGPFTYTRERIPDALTVLRMHHKGLQAPEALYLFQRVRGDMEEALGALEKASYFTGVVSRQVIDAFAQSKPSERLVEALIAGRKHEAFEAARSVPDEELSRSVGLLDSRLDALTRVGAVLRRDPDASIRKLCSATGLPAVTVVEVKYHAAAYDRKRLRRCTEALVFVDSAHAEGQDGLMEVLVALW